VLTILDKKTGHVEPWAALQLAAYTLLDAPVEFTEEGHLYHHEGARLPSVTGILKDEGFVDTTFFNDHARERGSLVHLATHLDDIGELDESSIDPVIAPYLEAWRRFRRESGFVIEISEKPMRSSIYGYAGTPDSIGYFPKKRTMKRAAVELHGDGTYRLVPFGDRTDEQVWLSAVACHTWKRNNLKGER